MKPLLKSSSFFRKDNGLQQNLSPAVPLSTQGPFNPAPVIHTVKLIHFTYPVATEQIHHTQKQRTPPAATSQDNRKISDNNRNFSEYLPQAALFNGTALF